MPFIDRPLVTDRPTVIDPVIGNKEDSEDVERDTVEEDEIEVLGEGGDEVVHGLEVGEEHEDIVRASNLVAILATGQEGGKLYSDVFKNAAFQLLEVDENGHTLEGMVDLSEELNVANLGTSWPEVERPPEDDGEEDTDVESDVQVEDSEESDEQEDDVEEDEETSEE